MKYLLIGAALALTSCATTTSNPETNARNAAINQTLQEATAVLGKVAVSALFNAARSESGERDYQQAAVQGLYANMDFATGYAAVKRIVNAYSAGKTPRTAQAAATAAEGARTSDVGAVNAAIAEVITEATKEPVPKQVSFGTALVHGLVRLASEEPEIIPLEEQLFGKRL